MGKCLQLNLPTAPQIPPILLPPLSFQISIDFGQLGITCCFIKLPAFQLPLAIPIPPTALIPIITAINAELAAAWPLMDHIDIPTCPMDGAQL